MDSNKNGDLAELKVMFCPPLEEEVVDRVLSNSPSFDEALGDLLALTAELEMNQRPSSPELPFSEDSSSNPSNSTSGDSVSSIYFLKHCFPEASTPYLTSIYQRSDQDVEKAVELYLSEEFIGQKTGHFQIPQQNKETSQQEVSNKYSLPNFTPKSKNKLKSKSKGKKGLHLDPGKFEHWSNLQWMEFENRYSALRNLFPRLTRPIVISSLLDSFCDASRATDFLTHKDLTLISIKDKLNATKEQELVLKLREVFPHHSLPKLAVYVFMYPSFDDTVQRIIDSDLSGMGNISLGHSDDSIHYQAVKAVTVQLHPAPYHPSTAPDPPPFAGPSTSSYDISDPKQKLEEMERMRQSRHQMLNQAAQAYKQRRSAGKQGIAFYYSDQARELQTRIEGSQYDAARGLVSSSSKLEIDLHGYTCRDAVAMAQGAVDQWYFDESKRVQARQKSIMSPLKLITGAGNHSANGKAQLKPAVAAMLRKQKWRFEIHHGFISVLGAE